MPNWKKLVVSGSNAVLKSLIVVSSGSIGTSSLGPNENTLTLGARDSVNEGGQLGLNAPGGSYVSASFIDTYQNRFRILAGTNAGSSTEHLNINLATGQLTANKYTGSGAFPGTAAGYLAIDTSGNVITTAGAGSSTLNIQDEGSLIGSATVINFTGAGVTATFAGSTATVNIPGGGSATAGGANTTIQFNDSTALSGSSNFTFNKTTNRVELTGSLRVSAGITGSLFGTASFATLAVSASVSSSTSAGTNYLLFAETAVGNTPLRTDTTLSYVPDTNTLNTHTVHITDKLWLQKALYATRGLNSPSNAPVIGDADFHVQCETQTGPVTVDLRNSENSVYDGRILVIKDYSYNAGSNSISFQTNGTIENGNGYTMAINGESIIIVYDYNVNTWWVIAKFTP